MCAQYFSKSKEIRILVADTGIGVHQALTTHPKSNYKSFSEYEAVLKCIEKGVTNSRGVGFGLWATSKLVQENKGVLIIHSGQHQLICSQDKKITKTSLWPGTYTFLKINTNIPVDHKLIFGENSMQKDIFDELKEQFPENINDLW